MALLQSGTFGSSPACRYELHATQVSGSEVTRNIKVTMKLKVDGSSSSKYGYPLYWKARIHNSYSEFAHVKGSEYWYGTDGWREYNWSCNLNVGHTGSGNITVGFELKRSDGGTSSWNVVKTNNFTFSATNSAPTMSGAVTTFYRIGSGNWVKISDRNDGTENSIKIPETADTIRCEWNRGSDDKGEANLTYQLYYQTNEGPWSRIYSGRNNYYEHVIGSGKENSSWDYYVVAVDKEGAKSQNIDALQFQKNKFTEASLNNIPNISFSTDSIKLSWSNPSNTINNNSFNYSITAEGIKIYNNTFSNTNNLTIAITNSAPSSGAYILKQDLINKFASSSYTGSLNFTLTTINAYGTSRTSSKTCNVNLQTAPTAASNIAISKDSALSTIYKTFVGDNNKYYIPDGTNNLYITWTKGSGRLGENVTYDVYFTNYSEAWNLLYSNLTACNFSHTIPKLNTKKNIKYKIRTKTAYGLYSDADSADTVLHYYSSPTITIGNIDRTSNQAAIKVTIKSNSSVDSTIQTKGSWKCNTKGTTTSVSTGTLTTSQNEQTIIATGLSENTQYELIVTYNDNSGFSQDATYTIAISGLTSVFFINRYGAGVGGAKADANSSLKVKGAVFPYGDFNGTVDYIKTPIGITLNETTNNGTSAGYPENFGTHLSIKYNDNRQFNLFAGTTNQLYFRTGHVNLTDGTATGFGSWKKIYHTGNKPSADDVGAITKTQVLNMFFPIGCIHITTSSTNPGSTMGGTWVAWGSGKVPVGIDTSDNDFKTVEKTGGSKTQDLRALIGAVNSNVGSLGYLRAAAVSGVAYTNNLGITGSTPGTINSVNHSTLVTQANNQTPTTIQPYITCYMWKRTA